MKKETTKSKIINAHNANPDFDPSQLSKVLAETGTTATPSYCDQVIREYINKQEKLGIDVNKASTITFEKVIDNPEKDAKVEQAAKQAKTETEKKEAPKTIKSNIKEPTPEDIKNLKEAATTPKNDVLNALISGKLNKEHIKSIFKIENFILKKYADGYEHDEATLDLLATSWEPVLDKYMSKLGSENTALYLAIATTVIAHVPVIITMAEKYGLMEKIGIKKKNVNNMPKVNLNQMAAAVQ